MGIDTSIYNHLMQRPKSVADYDNEAMQSQQNKLLLQMNRQKADEYTRGVERTNKLTDLLGGFKPGMSAADQGDALTRGGYLDEARKVIESGAKANKDQREAEKFQFEQAREQLGFVNQVIGAARDQASYTQGRQAMAARGMDVSQIPEQYDPAYVQNAGAQTMTQAQRLEQEWKAKGFDLDVQKFGEDKRKNRAQEADRDATRAQSAQQFNMRESRERAAPRGQIVQTDSGTMLVDPRTGEARPVMANGEALQPKLKSLPAPIQKALLENDAALRKVDDALGAIREYPEALGVKNYLGDTIRQRTDEKGVVARALVADIGSLKIHDRSGAAVTAAETPRLKPFIPAATDNPATVEKKLGLFRKEYEAIQQDINDTYTKEQGYRPPVKAQRPTPAASAAPKVGTVEGGYKFKGGNPADKSNWVKI